MPSLTMRPKLMFVVNDADFFLSHRGVIGRRALEAGYEVSVVAPPSPGAERIRAAGFGFVPWNLHRSGTTPTAEVASILALVRIYAAHRPSIVHHVTIKPVLYGGLAARATSVPAVVSAISGLGHVFQGTRRRTALLRRFLQPAYRVALAHPNSRVVFQNPADLETFVAGGLVPRERTTLIRGSGVDLGVFTPSPLPPGPPIVVLCSRMLWDKGVGEFVEAAKLLKARAYGARFVLVGGTDGFNPAGIDEKTLRDWHASGVVEWWGNRSDIPAVLRSATLVCLPSYGEGVPKVLLEAAACGRPIVASNIAGCREVVRPGENGELAPVRDAGALADAIERLLGDGERLRRYGSNARKLAEAEFSDVAVAEATLAIYRSLGA
jgi:glycosyltransferase involved in cell wall biosynthesis